MRISKFWAKNFRSIEYLNLELDPLTVLVGPNASGKSNITDVLRFVSDTVRKGLDSALTSRGGDQVARRSSNRPKAVEITFGFRTEEESVWAEEKPLFVEYEFVVRMQANGEYNVKQQILRVAIDVIPTEVMAIKIKNGRLIEPRVVVPRGIPREAYEQFTRSLGGLILDGASAAAPFKGILPIVIFFSNKVSSVESFSKFDNVITQATALLEKARFYHVFPNDLRDPQRMASRYPLDEHGGNLASVVHEMIRKKSPFLPDLLHALGQIVPGICDITVARAGSYLVVKLLHRSPDGLDGGVWLDLSQESDGTLRVLGLLVALFQDPTPPFMTIEEPELTVHPGALAVLADLIKEASERTSLLVTTHSPELLDNLPIECIQSVEAVDGVTRVGRVADHQREAVLKGLFSPGELHRMEGLQIAAKED